MVIVSDTSARLHSFEHRARLRATHFADYEPGKVLAKRLGDQVGDGIFAEVAAVLAFTEPDPRLEREHVAPPGLQMRQELVVGLERAEAFVVWDRRDKGAQ